MSRNSKITAPFMTRVRQRSHNRLAIASLALSTLVAIGGTARAQGVTSGFEIRPFVGAFIPTGDQRDLLKDAVLVGGQLSWHALPALALTGTFGWSPSKDRLTAGNQTLDIYQYDVGAELRAPTFLDNGPWNFTPFAGLGLGGRTYSYRDLDVDSKSNFDGYGALGGDIGFGPIALRIEARDYVSQFKPLTGSGDTKTRNDIGLAAGVSYRF
jgi:hypothetical protein